MSFEFKFEFLLKHRKREEEAAQREYFAAKKQLDECLDGIKSMYQSIEQTRLHISENEKRGDASSLGIIIQSETFIGGQKIRIERERLRARELMSVVESKHEILVETAREHKKILKLKEKMKAEFKKAYKRREQKRVDDLVVIRSGRRERL